MVEVKLPELECLRCGHKWTPRKSVVTVCPKCKSPYWNKKEESDAKTLRKRAEKLYAEAKALRKQAEELDIPKQQKEPIPFEVKEKEK